MKLLLPGVIKSVYNLNDKQIVKLFSRIFNCNPDDMARDLEQVRGRESRLHSRGLCQPGTCSPFALGGAFSVSGSGTSFHSERIDYEATAVQFRSFQRLKLYPL